VVTYLLDTNACIALLNGRPEQVRRRFERVCAEDAPVAIPAIVVFELCYGVARSAKRQRNAETLDAFLAGPLQIYSFEEDDARASGQIRADLASAGTPIGAYDILIAGQARSRGATLVTANGREFARVPGIVWQDWSRTSGP
jgi:tRNA(fMet)-specific endonuclease VapC